jgi:hypothetical protein
MLAKEDVQYIGKGPHYVMDKERNEGEKNQRKQ